MSDLESDSLSLDPQTKEFLSRSDVTYEDFLTFFTDRTGQDTSHAWRDADALLLMSEKLGDNSLSVLASNIKGYSKAKVYNYSRTARAFPPSSRLPNVSFTHHMKAALQDATNKDGSFTTSYRFQWIAKAADENLSVGQLNILIEKEELKKQLGTQDIPCNHCGRIEPDWGETKPYILFSPGERKRSKKLWLHEKPCKDSIVTFAMGKV